MEINQATVTQLSKNSIHALGDLGLDEPEAIKKEKNRRSRPC